jgi:hypothetical protein
MTLELVRPGRGVRRELEAEELRVRDAELRRWLEGLERWVEGQLTATDVLVRRTVNGRANGKARTRGG